MSILFRGIKELGLPTVLVVLLLLGGWRISARFLDSHDRFVTKVEEISTNQSRMMDTLISIGELRGQQNDRILATQQAMAENQRTMAENQKVMVENQHVIITLLTKLLEHRD